MIVSFVCSQTEPIFSSLIPTQPQPQPQPCSLTPLANRLDPIKGPAVEGIILLSKSLASHPIYSRSTDNADQFSPSRCSHGGQSDPSLPSHRRTQIRRFHAIRDRTRGKFPQVCAPYTAPATTSSHPSLKTLASKPLRKTPTDTTPVRTIPRLPLLSQPPRGPQTLRAARLRRVPPLSPVLDAPSVPEIPPVSWAHAEESRVVAAGEVPDGDSGRQRCGEIDGGERQGECGVA